MVTTGSISPGSRSVPRLETERLILRAACADDFEAYLAMMRDGSPDEISAEDAWRKFTSAAGLWIMFDFGYWSIERKSDAEFIGRVGFGEFKRGVLPTIDGLPEMGWRVRNDLWGQGYATEAVNACLMWADDALTQNIVAVIDPDNCSSIRVAAKAGFEQRCEAIYKDRPILIFDRASKLSGYGAPLAALRA